MFGPSHFQILSLILQCEFCYLVTLEELLEVLAGGRRKKKLYSFKNKEDHRPEDGRGSVF